MSKPSKTPTQNPEAEPALEAPVARDLLKERDTIIGKIPGAFEVLTEGKTAIIEHPGTKADGSLGVTVTRQHTDIYRGTRNRNL